MKSLHRFPQDLIAFDLLSCTVGGTLVRNQGFDVGARKEGARIGGFASHPNSFSFFATLAWPFDFWLLIMSDLV